MKVTKKKYKTYDFYAKRAIAEREDKKLFAYDGAWCWTSHYMNHMFYSDGFKYVRPAYVKLISELPSMLEVQSNIKRSDYFQKACLLGE